MAIIRSHTNVSVSGTSANGALTTAAATDARDVVLISTVDIYWNSGTASVTATSADYLLTAATPVQVTLPYSHDNIGAIKVTGQDDGVLCIFEVV